MTHETKPLVERFLTDLANVEEPPAESTMRGYRSLAKRLSEFCPRLPAPMGAVKRYLDETGDAKVATLRRRYDFGNRFFNSEPVHELEITNPFDLIARPGKIVVLTSVPNADPEVAAQPTTVASPQASPKPNAVAGPETDPGPVEGSVVATQPVVDRYLELCRLNGASRNTVKSYRAKLGQLANMSPTLPPSVDQIYTVLGDPEYCKSNTRRNRYAILHAFFNSATYLAENLPDPMAGVPRPSWDRTKKRKFTDAEIAALLDTGDAQEVLFVKLGLDAGPRVSEAASITVDCIDDDELTVDGKNGVRKIPISLPMAERLRSQANERDDIFHDERGRLTGDQLAQRFRDHAERAGITGPQIGPHTLRRTFGSQWINAGGSMRMLQDILGHSDVQTTEIYVDVVDEAVKTAHKQFSPAGRMGLFGDEWTSPGGEGPNGVAAEMVRRQTQEEVRRQMELDYLARNPCVERRNGRRLKVLPREIALLVLQDVEAGYSLSAIVERFKPICPFSRTWLAEVIKDGRLREMAGLSDGVSDSSRGQAGGG